MRRVQHGGDGVLLARRRELAECREMAVEAAHQDALLHRLRDEHRVDWETLRSPRADQQCRIGWAAIQGRRHGDKDLEQISMLLEGEEVRRQTGHRRAVGAV